MYFWGKIYVHCVMAQIYPNTDGYVPCYAHISELAVIVRATPKLTTSTEKEKITTTQIGVLTADICNR